jgi:hypothetical protein
VSGVPDHARGKRLSETLVNPVGYAHLRASRTLDPSWMKGRPGGWENELLVARRVPAADEAHRGLQCVRLRVLDSPTFSGQRSTPAKPPTHGRSWRSGAFTRSITTEDIAYAPALAGKDRRTINTVHGMEKALPGLRLEWEVGKAGHPIALPQRDAWLVERTQDGGFPLLCNGDERYPVTVNGRGKSGLLSPGGQPLSEVYAQLPLDEPVIASAAAVLEGVAEGARAFWGRATPEGAALDIAYQTAPTREGPPSPRRGLPALKLFKHIRSPEIPYYLGWLNDGEGLFCGRVPLSEAKYLRAVYRCVLLLNPLRGAHAIEERSQSCHPCRRST